MKWTTGLLAGMGLILAACAQEPGHGDNPSAREFVDYMVAEHEFDREELIELMREARLKESILKAIKRPAEKAKPWYEYRELFVTPQSIAGGVDFWDRNAKTLEEAEKKYGVPAEMIVAIIGIETRYGGNMGSYRVLDALATLAFNYPRRAPFFTKELENYLLLTREQGVDPTALVGSYAGAMGFGQFMPSSYRAFAVDFNGDGRVDIWTDTTDAIGSVANYFAEHGWKPGEPVTVLSQPRPNADMTLVNDSLDLNWTVGQLAEKGFPTTAQVEADTAANVFSLQLKKGKQYWIGLNNFYVITRYNRSRLYAMAAYELGREIVKARGGKP
ncbi:lytic murein transglycosylase B [Microbulbifer rhizosphaerae]|uniref:Membrane-bound lytic murein transglycosylase B n=1 Tax=Microbulbifer rhizosphaerae TaxID=1562603 RepID=A0A7W4WBI5_9GAMM|nr:lytic murein transglycosylase B [Microbulbifer rhizosphaerae]MBB3061232.1 membrane-bound lytic murein transglycosylase B [Microbulbifer rhizosphaerae]